MRGIWEGGTRKQMNHWQSGGKVVPIPDDYINISNFNGYLWGITNGEDTYYLRGGYTVGIEGAISYRSGYWFSQNAKTYGYKKNDTWYGVRLYLSDETEMKVLQYGDGSADIPDKEITPWVTYWYLATGIGTNIPSSGPDYAFDDFSSFKKGLLETITFNKIAVPNGYNKIVEGEYDRTYNKSRYSLMTAHRQAPFISRREYAGDFTDLYLNSYKIGHKQSGVLNKKLFTSFNSISFENDIGGLRISMGISDFLTEEQLEEYWGFQHHWHSGYTITKFTKR